ncbi:hypothetical protein AAHH80_40250, partial [Burkholderia pseudomallei]
MEFRVLGGDRGWGGMRVSCVRKGIPYLDFFLWLCLLGLWVIWLLLGDYVFGEMGVVLGIGYFESEEAFV